MYFSHVQDGQESFFAVVDVMIHHSIDSYGVPKVKRDRTQKHIVVVHSQNIIRCVGLMRFSKHEDEFHVVWQYAKFDDMLDYRPAGTLRDLQNL
ncbi:hypothetical protein G6F56_008880 [Rhizopus delemar]|nr:hypothetical protein G6F56_008880 [Rhizopus delemar]